MLIVWLPYQIEWIKVRWETGWVLVCLEEHFWVNWIEVGNISVDHKTIRKVSFIDKGRHFNFDKNSSAQIG